MTLTKLLASDGYICLNKAIIKRFGIATALILGELCSEYNYWETNNGLDDGYFYSTLENIENETTIKRDMQKKVFDLLKNYGVIDVKRKNMPARRYIKINEDKFFDFLQLCNETPNEIEEKQVQKITQLPEQFTTPTETSLRHSRKQDYDTDVNYINNNNIISNNINNNNIDNKLSILSDTKNPNLNSNAEQSNKQSKTKLYKLKREKSTKSKKSTGNIDRQFELIDIYFNNGTTCTHPEIASLIKQQLQQRLKKIGYKKYSDTRWENQLKMLIDNAEGDYEYMADIIKLSISRDYNDLTFPDQKKSLHKFKRISNNSFDTTANNTRTKGVALFTEEEKQYYEQNNLATDDNGNPLEF